VPRTTGKAQSSRGPVNFALLFGDTANLLMHSQAHHFSPRRPTESAEIFSGKHEVLCTDFPYGVFFFSYTKDSTVKTDTIVKKFPNGFALAAEH
jgi:3'-phosphoadenosine 5'-phosphosulfate sulfotransferase (PAPS reductase)/FAD synthetase